MTFDSVSRAEAAEPHDPSSRKWQDELASRPPVADGNDANGYGLTFSIYQNFPTIGQVFPGGAADRAGLRPNDRITAIQDKPTQGLTLDASNGLFHSNGANGVKLTVERDGKTFERHVVPGPYKTCLESPTYESFINSAANYFVDPQKMGNFVELQHRYDCQIRTADEAVALATKAIDSLDDPFTQVYSKRALEAEDRSNSNKLLGAGFGIEKDDQGWKVTGVVPGSPAEKADFHARDYLITVDGQPTKEWTAPEVVSAFRNGVGKTLDVQVDRAGKTVDVYVQPGPYKYPTIDKDLGDGIAYIRSTSFMPADAPAELKAALERHADAKAYVIDMRANGGGLVSNATSMAEMFVNQGTITTIQTRQPGSSMSNPVYSNEKIEVGNWFETRTTGANLGLGAFWLRQQQLTGNKPVVVLVDNGTASAAEMFTGALHDNHAATIVGEQTYGKGIGQVTLRGLGQNLGLHVTTLRYLTPSGSWLGDAHNHRYGITPDFIVHNDPDAKFLSPSDKQLNKAVEILKSKIQ